MQSTLTEPSFEPRRASLPPPARGFGAALSASPSCTPTLNRNGSIRVLLVDDHPLVRRGLAFCFAASPHVVIVGEASDGQDALVQAQELTPDVVLMDLDMPRLNGLAATEILRRELPQCKILIFSMHRDADFVLEAVRAGAAGYVLKQASLEELRKAIDIVHAGRTYFSPEISSLMAGRLGRGRPKVLGAAALSPREQEVLIGVAEGLSNKEIADRLTVSVRTVETYREGVMRKLAIRGAAGLTKYAIAKGLVPVPRQPSAMLAA